MRLQMRVLPLLWLHVGWATNLHVPSLRSAVYQRNKTREDKTAHEPLVAHELRSSPTKCPRTDMLIFGGNGLLGLEIVEAATQHGLSVTAVHRGNSYWGSAQRLQELQVCELRCSREDVGSCPFAVGYASVVDCSARTAADVAATVAALRRAGSAPHYVLISSEAVYAPVLYSAHAPLEEHAAVSISSMSWLQRTIMSADPYIQAKTEQEAVLKAALLQEPSMCASALRLPYVISARDTSYRLAKLIIMLEAGEVSLSPASAVPISFVDAASVASAVLTLLDAHTTQDQSRKGKGSHRRLTRQRSEVGAACGSAYNVAQPPIALASLLEAIASSGTLSPLGHAVGHGDSVGRALIPPSHADGVYEAVGFSQLMPFTLATDRLRALGWQPPLPLPAVVHRAARETRATLLSPNSTLLAERRKLTQELQPLLARGLRLAHVMRHYGLEVVYDEMPPPRLPVSFAGFMLMGALLAAAAPLDRRATVLLGALAAWWAFIVLSNHGDLVRPAREFAFSLRLHTWTAWKAYGWMNGWMGEIGILFLLAEVVLGVISIWATLKEDKDPQLRAANVAARTSIHGLPYLLLQVARLNAFYFLIIHKMSARWMGEGMAAGATLWRDYELVLFGCIIAHEGFQDWPAGLLTTAFYWFAGYCVMRNLHTAIGHGLGSKARTAQSWVYDQRFMRATAVLFSMVALFETHHLEDPSKIRCTAGRTAAIFTMMWFLALLPIFIIVMYSESFSGAPARPGARSSSPQYNPLLPSAAVRMSS